MKRSVALSVILVFAAAIAVAQAESSSTRFSNPLLNDIVRMSKAGLSDATVVAYAKARRARLDSILSAEDLIKMRRAGVSETVTQYLASVTAIDMGRSGEGRRGEVTYDSQERTVYPVERGYGGGYDYPYGYYPPYFSSSVVFSGRPFFRHHFFFRNPFFFSHQPFFRQQFFPHLFPHRFFHRPFFGRRFR